MLLGSARKSIPIELSDDLGFQEVLSKGQSEDFLMNLAGKYLLHLLYLLNAPAICALHAWLLKDPRPLNMLELVFIVPAAKLPHSHQFPF